MKTFSDFIQLQRMQKITKSNHLIQNLRTKAGALTLQEQRLILYLISKIKPEDEDFFEFDLGFKEFCEVCGITKAGMNYMHIKETVQRLADKSFWIESSKEKGAQDLVRWITDVTVSERGHIRLQMHPKLKPFLLHLRRFYTSYLLEYVLPMKSRYSISLYELLRSYANMEEFRFDVDELKERLDALNYSRWPDFQRKVLDIAIREINSLSDLDVSYTLEKEGRRIATICFHIRLISPVEQLERNKVREKLLSSPRRRKKKT